MREENFVTEQVRLLRLDKLTTFPTSVFPDAEESQKQWMLANCQDVSPMDYALDGRLAEACDRDHCRGEVWGSNVSQQDDG